MSTVRDCHRTAMEYADSAMLQTRAARNAYFDKFVPLEHKMLNTPQLYAIAAEYEALALRRVLRLGQTRSSDIISYSLGWLAFRAGQIGRALAVSETVVDDGHSRAQLDELHLAVGAELDGDLSGWLWL